MYGRGACADFTRRSVLENQNPRALSRQIQLSGLARGGDSWSASHPAAVHDKHVWRSSKGQAGHDAGETAVV